MTLITKVVTSIFLLGTIMAATTPMSLAQSQLTDAEVKNLVQRSWQYVAMYNVNNKFAVKQGGWNSVDADTELKDHSLRSIARPNNDSLYIVAMLDF